MLEFLHRNPWARSAIPLVLAAIVGVASSSLIVEVAKGNEIYWEEIFKKKSLYILILAIIISVVYQVYIFKEDSSFLKLTSKQFGEVLRAQLVSESAKHCKKLIKEERLDELIVATSKLTKLFEEDKQ